MRLSRLALIPAFALFVAACSTSSAPTAIPTAVPSSTTAGSVTPQVVEVRLLDALRMEPASMTVQANRPIRFSVTNMGTTDHEFYLGDEAAQMAHDGKMGGMPGMTVDEAQGIGLKPGETKTLEYTFAAAGTYQAGCHVSGHYTAGMKATITVTP